jgi:hypothetical protein
VNGSVSNISTRVQIHGSVNGSSGPIRTLDMQIISMEISGGNLPSGVRLRESPTLASSGKHIIRSIDAGFMISSFFDVFLEVSLDTGAHWTPSPTPFHLEYNGAVPEVPFTTDSFPPFGVYVSPANVPSRYGNGIILRNFHNRPVPVPSAFRLPPCLGCPPELYDFPTKLDFEASTDGGQSFVTMTFNAETRTSARHNEDTADTRFFETELLSLQVSPGPALSGLWLRESPSKSSLGKTTVRKLADRSFLISSFFDVFTEASLDNGFTWFPVANPTHLELSHAGSSP